VVGSAQKLAVRFGRGMQAVVLEAVLARYLSVKQGNLEAAGPLRDAEKLVT
jgi:hypothetical protein